VTDEGDKERVDRELIELLNELRVALPGVQVLFAFLLTVPFSQGFAKVTATQRYVYFASFMCTAVASAFLIAPSAYHRIQFRSSDKEQMLFTSNRMALTGTVFLALAIPLVVFVITDLLFAGGWAPVVTAAIGACLAWLWYGLPLQRRRAERSDRGRAARE
jgi:uncharacterized protein involved in cysteine biosynthesis